MAWRLKGTYFENCNCNMVCPCSTSGLTMPADNERCRVVLVFQVASGEIEGVDVSNLSIALLADAPRQMLAAHLPPLEVEGVSIAIVRWRAHDADTAIVLQPTQLSIVGDVTPNQITSLATPGRPL